MHVEGVGNYLNQTGNNGSHIEGYYSKIDVPSSMPSGVHVEGYHTDIQSDVMNPDGAHVEGYYTTGRGHYGSHTEGAYNYVISSNTTGKLAMHVVGIGDGNLSRKNAHVILKNGEHYIYGIGGYDGTNPSQSGVNDLATVVNAKLESSDLPVLKGDGDYSVISSNTSMTATRILDMGSHYYDVKLTGAANSTSVNYRVY